MDADEFIKVHQPAPTKSRLAPFWPEIRKLREQGYSLYVIQDFLGANNVTTSINNLTLFIKRQMKKELAGNLTEEPERQAARKTGTKPESRTGNDTSIVATISDSNTETATEKIAEENLQEDVRSQDDKELDKYMKVNSLRSRFEKPN